MRKVTVEAQLEVLVPVKVNVSILVRADEGANLQDALDRWAEGLFDDDLADIENVEVDEVKLPFDEKESNLQEFVGEHLDTGDLKMRILSSKITDSR